MILIARNSLLSLLMLMPCLAQAQPVDHEPTETAAEIWALEKRYMTLIQEGDLDGLVPFWHDKFLGWPSHLPRPVGQSQAIASIEDLIATTKLLAFELHPQALHVTGDIAIACYTVTIDALVSGEQQVEISYRIIHTWYQQNKRWQILGGMSSVIEGPGD
jgi:ketosteroid isomerase-like protein